MDKLATANINNLRISEADFVPSSEQSITVSLSQLRQIITEAVQGAIEPLQDEVLQLRATVARQGEKIRSLETTQEAEITRLCVDIATDRRRLSALEHPAKEPGKTETSRAEKIEKYLASRPDHRATFETLKGHLGIDKDRLKEAIKALMAATPGRYGIVRAPGDKRKRTLVMLPK